MTKVLVVQARFYEQIADQLVAGASDTLKKAGVDFDVMEVPGAFEIPGAIMLGAESGIYDGFVALGCVIRGETSHYDYVAGESSRALMDLSLEGVALGNGILTVENAEQAMVRASVDKKNKGADVANACLRMIEIREQLLADLDI
ncbi:MAG: 6,7-dimethyl-8-ribityllumazine synthase [Rhodospirillaceae bacterium]|nr:6,7-dimethyl-8-ribityllumazine synthase [Rhodospirillaceae bacterium]